MAKTQEDKRSSILTQVVGTIRASSAISAQDVDFYKSLDSTISESLDETSAKLLSLINDVVISIDENNDLIEPGRAGLENSWNNIGEVMDLLFEKSEHALAAMKKKGSNIIGNNLQYLDDSQPLTDTTLTKITKPQASFSRPVDNTESHPFKPLLVQKPNALRPLDDVLQLTVEEEGIPAHYPHPYEYEIDHQEYDESVLEIRPPIPSKPWEETDATWVDNLGTLNAMIKELSKAKELAIDLEHHDYRTYYGITCLMQISTRENDWLVDTIALRDHLWVLNEIFTNPKVIKVFHGAFMDVIWLQRDLGLYLVSLFDTFHASRLLGFPKHSLAYLLERYAHFKTSKKYQLADWRIRPLSKPLKAYARADTHFLLNIYDQMRNSLIEQGKLAQSLHNSRGVAKRRFEYTKFRPTVMTSEVYSPVEREDPWRSLIFHYNIPQSKSFLLKRLYEWRDTIARRDDESPRYVMPNQLLVALVMNAPTDTYGLLSVTSFVTEHVRSNAKSLSQLIKKTLASPQDLFTDQINHMDSNKSMVDSKLSPGDVKANHQNFDQYTRKSRELVIHGPTVVRGCSLFQGKPLPNEAYVSYQGTQVHHIEPTVLDDRRELVAQNITTTANVTEQLQVAVEKTPAPEVSDELDEGGARELSDDTVSQLKEDKDEIVVLKRRKALPQSSSPPKNAEGNPKEILDFKNNKKIMTATASVPRKSNKRFDPYAIQASGPDGVKRRKKTRGIQKSFK